jgi:hypothetical protein
MAVSSANVARSHPSAVGASEVNKLYKVGDKSRDGRLGPTLIWKVRKECMIRARKILQPL